MKHKNQINLLTNIYKFALAVENVFSNHPDLHRITTNRSCLNLTTPALRQPLIFDSIVLI